MNDANDLQRTIFDTLNANAALVAMLSTYNGQPAIFDEVPQANDAGNPLDFPYVVIGSAQDSPFDTDNSAGKEVVTEVHVWSRTANFVETKAIQGQIYNSLHTVDLPMPDVDFLGCDQTFSEVVRDPDGVTRHGVQRFLIRYEFL